MYTYYCVRKLRSQERLAAMARGVQIPMEPELPQGARSRRWGILSIPSPFQKVQSSREAQARVGYPKSLNGTERLQGMFREYLPR
jgi:hypothetical protein